MFAVDINKTAVPKPALTFVAGWRMSSAKLRIRRVTFFKSQDRERKVLIKAVNHDLVYSLTPTHANQIISGRDHTTHKGCCWSCKLESLPSWRRSSHTSAAGFFIFFTRFCLYLYTHIELLHCRLKCHDDNLSFSFHANYSPIWIEMSKLGHTLLLVVVAECNSKIALSYY